MQTNWQWLLQSGTADDHLPDKGRGLAKARGRDEWVEKYRRALEDRDSTGALLRRHEDPNSPTSPRATCHKERNKMRAKIGSHSGGDDGRAAKKGHDIEAEGE